MPLVCFVCFAFVMCGADGSPAVRHEFRSAHMGTQFRIVLYTAVEASANAASRAAFDRIGQLDSMLSDYRADSELMQLCSKAGGPPVHVSDELFFVLSCSQDLASRSDGAFDVSVGPVARLWRRARRQRKLPDRERLARARALVGPENVRLDAKSQTAQLLRPGMQLDLGGIAKGYAADEAMAVLKRHGITQALVAAAGDITVSGPPPGEHGWTIGIADPSGADKPPLDYLLLRDTAISTSGDTEQFLELEGKRYSHIIDPRTGLALTHRVQVTVVAPNATTSDSLATAVCVLGPERGMQLVESTPQAAALIVHLTESGPTSTASNIYGTIPKGRAKNSEK